MGKARRRVLSAFHARAVAEPFVSPEIARTLRAVLYCWLCVCMYREYIGVESICVGWV